MKKNRLTGGLLLFVIFLLSFGISAVADLKKSEIINIARKEVPSGCKLTEVSYDKEEKDWECEFLTKNKKVEFEITVDAISGKVKEKEMEKQCDKGGKCVRITKQRARCSIIKLFKDAIITRVKKCKDDGFWIYRVWFHGDGYTADAEVNASTAAVNEWTKYF